MNHEIKDCIAFWASMILANVCYFGGGLFGTAGWLIFGGILILRARRARRIAEGRPSFWQKVWDLR